MNTAMVFQTCEAPNYAAVKTQAAQSKTDFTVYGKNAPKAKQSFKKKLQSCEEGTILQQIISQLTALNNSSKQTDNSMACDSGTGELLSGIVGILEGFGLLDYQTDNTILQAQATDTNAINQQEIMQKLNALTEQAAAGQENIESLSEQFARMLTNNQLDSMPKEAQEKLKEAVGKYLCSFESTNKKQSLKNNEESAVNEKPAVAVAAEKEPAVNENTIAGVEYAEDSKVMEIKKNFDDVISGSNEENKTVLQKEELTTAQKRLSSQTKITSAENNGADNNDGNTAEISDVTANVQEKKTEQKNVIIKEQSGFAEKNNVNSLKGAVNENTPAGVKEIYAADTAEQTESQAQVVKQNVTRIVEKVNINAKQGKYDFEVELKPGFLGKVNIKLTMENGDIKMRIKTEDLAVKELFSEQMPSLQSMMKEKGIAVSDIDVTYENQMFADNENQAFEQNNGGTKETRYRKGSQLSEKTIQNLVYDAVTDLPDLYFMNSSVEFLA